MSPNATPITVVGRLITDVDTRVTTTGDKVANFRIACQERHYDRDQNLWVDGDRMYVGVACWRALAEHAAASLHKGDQVVVSGRLKISEFTNGAGARKTSIDVNATAVGPDLARHTVAVHRPDWAISPNQQTLLNAPPGRPPTGEPAEEDLSEAA